MSVPDIIAPYTDPNSNRSLLVLSIHHVDAPIVQEQHNVLGAPTDFDLYALFEKPFEPTLGVNTKSVDFPNEDLLPVRGQYKTVVGMTMYNEDKDAFERSLRGVLRRGAAADLDLKTTLVVVIVDGVRELHSIDNKDLVTYLEELKLYDRAAVESTMKAWADHRFEKPADCTFVFRRHIVLSDTAGDTRRKRCCRPFVSDLSPASAELKLTKGKDQNGVDVLFVVKPDNRRKLHSHLWLMYGFCVTIAPTSLVVRDRQLVDIGTEPLPGAIQELVATIEDHPTVGGCCGEIIVRDWLDPTSNKKKSLSRRIVASLCLMAQWFEYKIGHALYKPLEHMFGYISVLPGAFSAYRWEALCADKYRVLKAYFKPFIAPHKLLWIESNVYFLAEDRIMSEEIVKISGEKEQHGYRLAFAQKAKATTEGAPGLVHFILQRRRWINGAWFALIKVALHGDTPAELSHSGHSRCQRFLLSLEIYYLQILIAFTWVSVGAYYLAFAMTLRKLLPFESGEKDSNEYLFYSCKVVYIFMMMITFVVSLALNPKRGATYWYVIWGFMSLVSIFISVSVVYFLATMEFESTYSMAALYSVIAAVGIAIVLYFEDWLYILLTFAVYILWLPSYVNILSVYAICKTDDLTWGTRKTSSESSTEALKQHFSRQKTIYLMIYTLSNVVFAGVFESLSEKASKALEILYGAAFVTMLCPVLACVCYALAKLCNKRRAPETSKLPDMEPNDVENAPARADITGIQQDGDQDQIEHLPEN